MDIQVLRGPITGFFVPDGYMTEIISIRDKYYEKYPHLKYQAEPESQFDEITRQLMSSGF